MQIKSLPSLKEIKQKILKIKKTPKSQSDEEPQEENLSPNLLTPIATKSLIKKAKPKLAQSAKNLALLTLFIYAIFFAVNLYLNIELKKEEKRRDVLASEIEKNAYVEDTVRNISKAAGLYKKVESQNADIHKNLTNIINDFKKRSEVVSIFYDRENKRYRINTVSDKATKYAFLITDLLNEERVLSIAITKVEYDTKSGYYEASFDINVK